MVTVYVPVYKNIRSNLGECKCACTNIKYNPEKKAAVIIKKVFANSDICASDISANLPLRSVLFSRRLVPLSLSQPSTSLFYGSISSPTNRGGKSYFLRKYSRGRGLLANGADSQGCMTAVQLDSWRTFFAVLSTHCSIDSSFCTL